MYPCIMAGCPVCGIKAMVCNSDELGWLPRPKIPCHMRLSLQSGMLCIVLHLDFHTASIFFFYLQASAGMWEGWFITESLVIAIHLILIILDFNKIMKTYTGTMDTHDNSIEMDDLGGATLSGIQINKHTDKISSFLSKI